MRLLVIEDEKGLLNIIGKRLKEEGFAVDLTGDGREGLDFAESANYACIILDLMLPTLDGFSIIRKLRTKKINSPILVLTVKNTLKNKIDALDYGADDYITKPFSFEELVARIRVLTRRISDEKDIILSFKGLTLNLNTREVYRNNKLIELTSKEFAILEYFLRNKSRILKKSQIAEHVWNYGFDHKTNIIEVYIRYLRKKVDVPYDRKLIHTITGMGYGLK